MTEQTQYDILIDQAVRKYAAWRETQPLARPHRLSIRMNAEELNKWHKLAAEAGCVVGEGEFAEFVRNAPDMIRDLQRQVADLTAERDVSAKLQAAVLDALGGQTPCHED